MKVQFANLDRQFRNIDQYLDKIRTFVQSQEFTLNDNIQNFERNFAKFCNAPYAISVKNKTDALAISLKMLGIEKGDEVITSALTHISTLNAIVQVGAKPVLVDCTEELVLSSEKIDLSITEKTKAIIVSHYGGSIADLVSIKRLADEYQLSLVEDASYALGAQWKNHLHGALSDAACYSFGPNHTLSTWVEGAMIVTHSEELAEKASLYGNLGLIGQDEALMFGVDSRMDRLQAIVANQLMEELEHLIKIRIKNAKKYDAAFSTLSAFIRLPQRKRAVKSSFDQYVIFAKDRDRLQSYLFENGIETHTPQSMPVYLQRAADSLGYVEGSFPICEKSSSSMLALPIHQNLMGNEIDYVIEMVSLFYKSAPAELVLNK